KARTTTAGRRRTCSGKPDRRAERGLRPNVLQGTLPFTVLNAGALSASYRCLHTLCTDCITWKKVRKLYESGNKAGFPTTPKSMIITAVYTFI
ncbi:MAG: hypothetical protein LBH90_09265, partial [Tannerella sp.]|nr:hypothetical protein [Tannerella sp.]